MSKFKCGVCGKDPAEGFASVYANGKETYYCHPDEGPSCYARDHVTWRDLFGIDPDFTGGMDTAEFLEQSRGDA